MVPLSDMRWTVKPVGLDGVFRQQPQVPVPRLYRHPRGSKPEGTVTQRFFLARIKGALGRAGQQARVSIEHGDEGERLVLSIPSQGHMSEIERVPFSPDSESLSGTLSRELIQPAGDYLRASLFNFIYANLAQARKDRDCILDTVGQRAQEWLPDQEERLSAELRGDGDVNMENFYEQLLPRRWWYQWGERDGNQNTVRDFELGMVVDRALYRPDVLGRWGLEETLFLVARFLGHENREMLGTVRINLTLSEKSG